MTDKSSITDGEKPGRFYIDMLDKNHIPPTKSILILKMLSISLVLVLCLALFPNAASQGDHYDPPPRLYLFNDAHGTYLVHPEDNEYTGYRAIPLGPLENMTLSIHGVKNRIFNPEVKIRISLDPAFGNEIVYLGFEMRFDGDGDGDFEFIVHFNQSRIEGDYDREIISSYRTGSPINMTNGTIELYIWRMDDLDQSLGLEVNRDTSYIQIPFDLDTDGDGEGDYSDSDDDNDGHYDYEDVFPKDKNEWKDTDGDGIGDNEDVDDNDNGIPDDFELPMAMCIVLIPILIIGILMKRMKKKSGGNDEEEPDFKPITTSRTGPKNW
jgi:hypothetical protein